MPHDNFIQPWMFRDRDGKRHVMRPPGPFVVEVYDLAAFEEAVRSGRFYLGLGGEITDVRKTTG